MLCCVSSNKLCACFYSFCLLEKFVFQTGQEEPGELCFQPLARRGLVAKIPNFHSGYPDSIPGQGTKTLLLFFQDQDEISLPVFSIKIDTLFLGKTVILMNPSLQVVFSLVQFSRSVVSDSLRPHES